MSAKPTKDAPRLPQREREAGLPAIPEFDLDRLAASALLRTDEVAGYLRLAVNTLISWHQQRKQALPWVLVAGRPRYRAGDVRTFIADNPQERRRPEHRRKAKDCPGKGPVVAE
jgi:hypothetical protein